MPRDGLEVIEVDANQRDVGLYAGVRLCHEIGVTVYSNPAVLKDRGLHTEHRGVRALLGVDVSDVLGDDLDALELERPEGSLVDVGHGTVANTHTVDLQRIYLLEGLLPSVLVERCGIGCLRFDMSNVREQCRLEDGKIGHDPTEKQFLPLHAGVQAWHVEDGWIGMRLLDEAKGSEGQ